MYVSILCKRAENGQSLVWSQGQLPFSWRLESRVKQSVISSDFQRRTLHTYQFVQNQCYFCTSHHKKKIDGTHYIQREIFAVLPISKHVYCIHIILDEQTLSYELQMRRIVGSIYTWSFFRVSHEKRVLSQRWKGGVQERHYSIPRNLV